MWTKPKFLLPKNQFLGYIAVWYSSLDPVLVVSKYAKTIMLMCCWLGIEVWRTTQNKVDIGIYVCVHAHMLQIAVCLKCLDEAHIKGIIWLSERKLRVWKSIKTFSFILFCSPFIQELNIKLILFRKKNKCMNSRHVVFTSLRIKVENFCSWWSTQDQRFLIGFRSEHLAGQGSIIIFSADKYSLMEPVVWHGALIMIMSCWKYQSKFGCMLDWSAKKIDWRFQTFVQNVFISILVKSAW